jgi:hypothetical protein
MTGIRAVLVATAVVVAAILGNLLVAGDAGSGPSIPANPVLARELAIYKGEIKPGKFDLPVSAGVMYAVLEASGVIEERVKALGGPAPQGASRRGTRGCPNRFEAQGTPPNIRVNQDCSLRRQAEEVVLENPTDPENLVAGQNDSRIGFNHCGYDWSFNDGRNWGDMVPPFWQHQLPDGHTSDACSDPTLAFDSVGNLYAGGIIFDVAAPANGVVVAKSNARHGGTFYHSPLPGPFQEYSTAPLGVVAESAGEVFHDKELIAADSNPDSPKADNVYMTWTIFQEGNSPIFFGQSTDGGATWSEPVEISGSSEEFCTVGNVEPFACDQDQGSHPTVGVDGTVYVSFGNGNVPGAGQSQVLVVWCPPDLDCSQESSWNGPTRVSELVGTHPIGDGGNAGGCPTGRRCLPPNGYRAPEFTSISNSSDNQGNVYVVWSDFRNGDDPGSTCGPNLQWSQAEPPCNNDVFYAFSTDGGETWSETRNITPPSEFGQTAQWQPWSDVTGRGGRLMVAFYDRSYGNCEFEGCNDITAVAIADPRTDSPTYTYKRITTGSMPNLTPANNPVQAGFLGDYMWVDVGPHNSTHIVWADTRPHPLIGTAPEEDIYYAALGARFGQNQGDGTQD